MFVEVQVMTNKGGTNYSAATVVYYLYDKAFSNGQLGYGCALAVILAIIIFIITALNFAGQDRVQKKIWQAPGLYQKKRKFLTGLSLYYFFLVQL